jgi:hypothetical protein
MRTIAHIFQDLGEVNAIGLGYRGSLAFSTLEISLRRHLVFEQQVSEPFGFCTCFRRKKFLRIFRVVTTNSFLKMTSVKRLSPQPRTLHPARSCKRPRTTKNIFQEHRQSLGSGELETLEFLREQLAVLKQERPHVKSEEDQALRSTEFEVLNEGFTSLQEQLAVLKNRLRCTSLQIQASQLSAGVTSRDVNNFFTDNVQVRCINPELRESIRREILIGVPSSEDERSKLTKKIDECSVKQLREVLKLVSTEVDCKVLLIRPTIHIRLPLLMRRALHVMHDSEIHDA